MKSFWHPGYEGTCYDGKQTAIDEILDPGAGAFHAGVFRGTNSMGGYGQGKRDRCERGRVISSQKIKIRVVLYISFTLSVLGVTKIYFLPAIFIHYQENGS